MKRWKISLLALLVLSGGGATAAYIDYRLAEWQGPTIGTSGYGTPECSDVTRVVPRQLKTSLRDNGKLIRTDPVRWEDVLVRDLPEDRLIDHGLKGPVLVGQRVCTVEGSQLWIDKPTGWLINYWCSRVDWPDCPRAGDFFENPNNYEWV